jgi:hypothetical protein
MSSLILKRASASRPSGEWNEDDYDVLADGVASAGSCSNCSAPATMDAPKRSLLAHGLTIAQRRR